MKKTIEFFKGNYEKEKDRVIGTIETNDSVKGIKLSLPKFKTWLIDRLLINKITLLEVEGL